MQRSRVQRFPSATKNTKSDCCTTVTNADETTMDQKKKRAWRSLFDGNIATSSTTSTTTFSSTSTSAAAAAVMAIAVSDVSHKQPAAAATTTKMVVHCRHSKFDVYVGRPSKWGNPFKLKNVNDDVARDQVIKSYEEWILKQPALLAELPSLKGKVLACHCAPKACHADVLARLANQ